MTQTRLFQDLPRHGANAAIVNDEGLAVSYLELDRQSAEITQRIEGRSLIFCICTNTTESVIGYVALTRAGHVCLMLGSSLDADRLRALVNAFRPNFFWAPSDHQVVDQESIVMRLGQYVLAQWSADRLDMHPALSVLMATSGSTGSPVMVRQSFTNLFSNATSIVDSLSLTVKDRALTTLPMNYTYGLSIINSQLECGGSLFITDASLMDRRFWNVVGESGATYFGGVPYTYEMLNRVGIKRLRGSRLRMLTQAGGKLSTELVASIQEECRAIGLDFYVMYGQTEATARMSVLSPEDAATRPSSIGKPILNGRFRILDLDDDLELPVGEVGELEYSGPNVTMGYAADSRDLVLGDERNGRLRTGDLAVVDTDGFYFIVGRRKRFVKLYGHRINLDDIELHLMESGVEAVCTGDDDSLIVHVVGNHDERDIVNTVTRFVGVVKSAVRVHRISKIPRNEAGKILYSQLGGESNK